MSSLLSYPKFKGESSVGIALSGGLLYTYEAGTTTAKTTYSDSALTTPNTNPVVLDVNGEATVWLNGKYTFVLKDSSEVIQWTVDNVDSLVSSSTFSTDHNSNGTHKKLTVGSDANGDMYYRSAGTLTRLAKGTEGQVVVMGASAPEWSSDILTATTGTWTITFTCETSGTITLSSDSGWYAKHSNVVIAGGYAKVGSVSSPLGDVRISLPLASALCSGVATVWLSGVTFSQQYLVLKTVVGQKYMYLYDVYKDAQSEAILEGGAFVVDDWIRFTMTYFTS